MPRQFLLLLLHSDVLISFFQNSSKNTSKFEIQHDVTLAFRSLLFQISGSIEEREGSRA